MAIKAITPDSAFGYGIASDAAMVMLPSTGFNSSPFMFRLSAGDTAAGRIRGKNNTTWSTIAGGMGLTTAWYWQELRVNNNFPTDKELLSVLSGTNVLIGTLRIRSDGKFRYHDFAGVASSTAKATCNSAIDVGGAYIVGLGINTTAQTVQIAVFQAGALVSFASASSVNYNSSTVGQVVRALEWQFNIDGGGWQGDIGGTYSIDYALGLIDDAVMPPLGAKIGVQWANADGLLSGFVTDTGSGNKYAKVADMNGNTSYIKSTSASDSYSATFQSCASVVDTVHPAGSGGINGTVLAMCPGFSPWDAAAACGSLGKLYENGVLTSTGTSVNRGGTPDLHYACPLYNQTTLMPSGAPLNIASANTVQVAVFRDATTNEFRVGSIANVVVHAPLSAGVKSNQQALILN